MSLSVKVQKDIGSYEEKVIGKMTLRTLACVAGGIGCAIAVAVLCHFGFGINVADATLPVMAAAMPFWLFGFTRPHHMKPEQFLPLWWRHHFGSKRLLYQPSFVTVSGESRLEAGKPSRRARRRAHRKGVELRESSSKARTR